MEPGPDSIFAEINEGASVIDRDAHTPHWQVLLVMFLSMIVHLLTPGGICSEAVPVLTEVSTFISTLLSVRLC